MSFKKDFAWGAATAAFQVEGAAYEDGKGLSIWDEFCKLDGKVYGGHTGDVACDHYHRFKEDVKLMADMGMKAYRFSISWPRILPAGTGMVNEKGLQFYIDLVDELIKYNITPYVTLFHWDYPAELQRQGAWMNPESPKWFENYVRVVIKALGERVKHYITFNEPQVFIGLAYVEGIHAPGYKMQTKDIVIMSHHVMKAHGLAVKTIREICPECKVGYAPCSSPKSPLTNSKEDIEAARKEYFSISDIRNGWEWSPIWWSDPIMLGKYPEEGLKLLKQYLPDGWKEDLKIINQPLDFYGQNMYCGYTVKDNGKSGVEYLANEVGNPRTACCWPITPECLYWGSRFLYERYKTPVIVTENGLSCHDVVSLDGKVHDPNRIDFLHRYLKELKKAVDDGVDIEGYFQWSLLDNFEWSRGYDERFGLIFVNYQTQLRIPKDSYYWYKQVIESNGENL